MRHLAVFLLVCVGVTHAQDFNKWSVSFLAADGDAYVAAGRVIGKEQGKRGEIGLHGHLYDAGGDSFEAAIGPYGAVPVLDFIPLPEKIESWGTDLGIYLGASLLFTVSGPETGDDNRFKSIFQPFATVLLYPYSDISPVVAWKYSFVDESVTDSSIDEGNQIFFGIRGSF